MQFKNALGFYKLAETLGTIQTHKYKGCHYDIKAEPLPTRQLPHVFLVAFLTALLVSCLGKVAEDGPSVGVLANVW